MLRSKLDDGLGNGVSRIEVDAIIVFVFPWMPLFTRDTVDLPTYLGIWRNRCHVTNHADELHDRLYEEGILLPVASSDTVVILLCSYRPPPCLNGV
jgi:hypothetical protein